MVTLSGEPLTLEEIRSVAFGAQTALSSKAAAAMTRSRTAVEAIVRRGDPAYGINTGFGKLADVRIPDDRLAQLQLNLVRSHACGVGSHLSDPEVRAMMLLRANVLAVGCSGARPEAASLLVAMLNAGIAPHIPELGSVGASGDLAPLAHLALAVIGEGTVCKDGEPMSAREALEIAELVPLELEAKEGLALLNGTQAMGAVGGMALARAFDCWNASCVAGAMTLDALLGTTAAFDDRIQQVRPHQGQIHAASLLRSLLEGSEIRESHRTGDSRVQDAYCLRCMPQVHGAVYGALEHAKGVLEVESGSATDNPLVFADSGDVLSGGNFHGAPLAYAWDYAAIALTDLASIAERRIDRLVNPDLNEGLPPFLTRNPGLESGMMMAHVTAAALLAECKVLAHPASVDSVPTSGGKEDHVSMGMTAALKLRRIVDCLERVLAIELIAAASGLSCRLPMRTGPRLQRFEDLIHGITLPLSGDRSLTASIEQIAKLIRQRALKP